MSEDAGKIMAVAMEEVAFKATKAAKRAMIEAVEEAFPDNDRLSHARQIGAMITCATVIYADMLKACVNSGKKSEAALVAGLLDDLISEPLQKLAALSRR